MVEPAEVAPGIFLVAIPMQGPLRAVNCYLCRGAGGWTVVDAGPHTPAAEEAWPEALAACGAGWRDIERIVVTHYHPDHLGAAGWLQERSGAPALILDRELPQVRSIWQQPRAHADGELAMFARHGMPAAELAHLDAYYDHHHLRVAPLAELSPVREGEPVPIGDASYLPVWTPGHTPGLMVLWRESDGLTFVDDMVLADITPNVSMRSEDPESPLGGFLRSLEAMARLGAGLCLPGHRRLITDVGARAREIARHHHERLEQTRALVAEAPAGRSGWEVCLGLFGRQVTLATARFALGEALAHLEYLVEAGRLERRPAEGGDVYLARP